MQTYIPTRTELDSAISEAVERTMRSLVPEIIRKATAKEFLTKEELHEMTGWSSRTIQNLRDTRQIPFTKHGKKILYPYNGIMEFFKKNHVKPIM
jgi:transcriptional regulator of met regulon